MQTDSHTIVVTGAGGHLGRPVVEMLLERGFSVLAATKRAVRLGNGSTWTELGAGTDLSTAEGASHLHETVRALNPARTSVVNCVGYFPGYKPFSEVGYGESERTIHSNFTAVYFTALSLMPLVRQNGGHFVTFTTLSAPDAYPLMTAFDSSKCAVEQLTRHLANEFGKDGVRANTLALATLKTPDEIRMKPHGDHDHWVEPRDVAEMVCGLVEGRFGLVNGTTFKCYRYSTSFFGMSYFERVME